MHLNRFILRSFLAAFSAGCLAVWADGVVYTGVTGGDWNTGANWSTSNYPASTDYALLDTTVSLDTEVSNNIRAVRIGTAGTGVLHVAAAGSLSASAHASWDSHIGSGSGSSGTLNCYGGAVTLNELEIGRSEAAGLYNLYGGSLTIERQLQDYSIYLGTDDGKGTAGDGTLYISGGSVMTRAGVYLGSADGGIGTFQVEGAGASEISIGSHGSIDGSWMQHAGSTLRVGIDKSSTGVTPIFIDYVDGTGLGGDVVFEAGALLDVGFTAGFVNGGTYTVMTWEGDVTNNGLQFASSVDTNIWSFHVDEVNKELTVTAAGDAYVRTFVHPGLSHKLSDLERMRDMVDAGIEPWASTYEELSSLARASYDVTVGASSTNVTITTMNDYWDAFFINDGTSAYYNSLMWMLTGDSRHADKAVEIFNAWSYLTRNEQTMALQGGRHWRIIEAAEIIQSTYDGWDETDKQRFKDMLVYPGWSGTTVPEAAIDSDDVTFYWRVYDGDPARHGNQGLFGYRVMLAMAVFLDNEVMYDRAVRVLKGHPHADDDVAFASGPPVTTGPLSSSNEYYDEYSRTGQEDTVADYGYNEVMWNYIWENGQGQESSRDQAHALAGTSTIATMCEIMWNQGDDLYSYLDNRVLLGLEHYYRYNLSWTNSYPDQLTSWEPTAENGEFIQRLDRSGRWKSLKINPYTGAELDADDWERGKHNLQPVYEMNLAHYRDRMNVSSNETKWLERGFEYLVSEQEIELEGTVTDHPGYGGLKFRRVSPGDPISGFDGSAPLFEMNTLPMTVEAENYDYFPISGQGRTYYDLTDHNTGTAYRPVDGVDIAADAEADGGYALVSIEAGEWITYTVSVPSSGYYDISVRYAADAAGGTIQFSFDGTDKTGDVAVPGSGGAWTDLVIAQNVQLEQGVRQLKISFSGASNVFSLDAFTITKCPVLPVAHWAFDDGFGTTAADSSGNGYDGSVDAALWTNGMIGGALYLDGTGSVDLPAAAFGSISNQVSISFWARGDAAVPDNSAFYATASGKRALNVHLPYGSTVYWDAGGAAGAAGYDRISKTAADSALEEAWNHWVFTKNAASGSMKIYRNGSLWHSGTGHTISMNGINAGYIGGQANGTYYKGIIDDVQLYDVELSLDEVEGLHHRLVAAWSFDEGSGTAAANTASTGSAYDGTVNGSPAWVAGFNGIGSALDFSGVSGNYVSIPSGDFADSVSNEISIAFWAYGSADQPQNQIVFQGQVGTSDRELQSHLPWGDNENIYWDAADRFNFDAADLSALWKGAWTFWVMTKDAADGTMQVYANGELMGSGTDKSSAVDGAGLSRFAIGGDNSGTNPYYGIIDEFQVYNYALSLDEIETLYDGYLAETANGTPTAWLDYYGLTEADDDLDGDADGLLTWEEYIAGTNPTVSDAPALSGVFGAAANSLYWNDVDGRIYNVYWSSNLTDGFMLIESNALNGAYTDTERAGEPVGFYRFTVELEP